MLGHWEDIQRSVVTDSILSQSVFNGFLTKVSTDLAGSQVKVGDLDAAKTTLERFSANGSQTHSTRTLLGVVRYLLGDIPGAVAEWIAAAERELITLEASIGVGVLTEQQVLQYQPTELEDNAPISYLLSAFLSDEVAAVDTIWEFVARTRPVRFDEILSRHRVVSERNPELTRLADNLASARARVAQGLVQAVSVPTEQNREALRTLRDERDEAEVALTQANHAYQETRTNATGQEFRAARARLATREALVAFFAYGRYDWVPEQYDSRVPSYVAFIQTGQQPPVIVPIGTEEEVRRSVEAWRQEVARPAETGELPTVDDEHRYREAGATLRELVWDPLAPHLSNVDQVFVVPDGALHTVTLSSLPSGIDAYLLEEGPSSTTCPMKLTSHASPSTSRSILDCWRWVIRRLTSLCRRCLEPWVLAATTARLSLLDGAPLATTSGRDNGGHCQNRVPKSARLSISGKVRKAPHHPQSLD